MTSSPNDVILRQQHQQQSADQPCAQNDDIPTAVANESVPKMIINNTINLFFNAIDNFFNFNV